MIPKIFHRVWLGGKPMPEPFVRWGESWLTAHPDWTMKLWTEREIGDFKNRDLLPRCSSLAQQADIVRYEALAREGGVYLDTDMECLRNIESLIRGVDFFCCWQKQGIISNAIFGAAPGYGIVTLLTQYSRTEFKSEPWNAMGPPFFTSVIMKRGGAKIFPRETFIPYTRDEYKALPAHPMEGLAAPPEAYAINHRSSIWYADSTRPLGQV
jgi:mannosyltransferase OCH1-like enzyme